MLFFPLKAENVSDEIIEYIDKYLKTIISNTQRRFCKDQQKAQKYDIIFVELEKFQENLYFIDSDLEEVNCGHIEFANNNISIQQIELEEAISQLTAKQKNVLIKNVLFEIPLYQIAKEMGISTRMAEKHKSLALKYLRRRLHDYEKI